LRILIFGCLLSGFAEQVEEVAFVAFAFEQGVGLHGDALRLGALDFEFDCRLALLAHLLDVVADQFGVDLFGLEHVLLLGLDQLLDAHQPFYLLVAFVELGLQFLERVGLDEVLDRLELVQRECVRERRLLYQPGRHLLQLEALLDHVLLQEAELDLQTGHLVFEQRQHVLEHVALVRTFVPYVLIQVVVFENAVEHLHFGHDA